MKKLFAVLLAAILVLSLVACKPQSSQTETHAHDHIHEDTTSPSEETQEVTATDADTSQQASSQPASSEASADNDTPSLLRGNINGNIYTSDFTGLKFTKPESFTYLSEAELASKINVSTEELADEIFPYTADRVPAVYDMWATDKKSGISISVAYENMHITAAVALSTDQYMEMLESAFENTKGTALVQKSTVDLSGKMYQKAIFTTETGDTQTQSIYYIRAMGKFMNIVLVTAPADTEIPNIEKLFS